MSELLEFFFTIFIFYFLYKLLFNLILPLSKTSSSIRNKVKEMNAQQQMNKTEEPSFNYKMPGKKNYDSEYIDFEEVK